MMDITLLSYMILKYALIYSLVLFAIWLFMVRREGGHISQVYIIVMGLFVTRLFGVGMGIRARHLRDLGNAAYFDFMSGMWWDIRLAPEATIFIILAVVLTNRFVRSYFFNDPNYRKQNGRRKADAERPGQ